MPPRRKEPIPTALPAEGFVRKHTILAVFPVSDRAWDRGVKSGIYPKPVKLSERVNGWDVNQIRALLPKRQ